MATGFTLPAVIKINIKSNELKMKYDRLANTINFNSIDFLLNVIYKK